MLGKFLAAWLVIGAALLLTTPLWGTVNYLGDPDNGVIVAGYLGSWLMAAAFLAQGACLSAATSNQVVAFVSSVALGFLFVIIGFAPVVDFLHGPLGTSADLLASLSFLTHFQAIAKGVLYLEDIVFFMVLTVGWLMATAIVIRLRQSG